MWHEAGQVEAETPSQQSAQNVACLCARKIPRRRTGLLPRSLLSLSGDVRAPGLANLAGYYQILGAVTSRVLEKGNPSPALLVRYKRRKENVGTKEGANVHVLSTGSDHILKTITPVSLTIFPYSKCFLNVNVHTQLHLNQKGEIQPNLLLTNECFPVITGVLPSRQNIK